MNIIELRSSNPIKLEQERTHAVPEELNVWYHSYKNTEKADQAQAILELYKNFSDHLLYPKQKNSQDSILAINKPPFTTTTGNKYMLGVNDVIRLATGNPDYHAIHRLDRDTSGVLLFAATKNTRRALHKRFENRQVSKTYIAVLNGDIPSELAGVIAPLGDSLDDPQLSQVIFSEKSKKAATAFMPIATGQHRETNELFTIMKINLLSGRKHQIRAHSSQVLNTPLVGDHQYDKHASGSNRHLLHAYSLKISLNPGTDNEIPHHFIAPIPNDFYSFLEDKKLLYISPEFVKIFQGENSPPPFASSLSLPTQKSA